MLYLGYGFLSENPELATCAEAALPSSVLAPTRGADGQQGPAIAAAQEAGLLVLNSSTPSASVDELVSAAADMQFPVFVKAVSGGAGAG
jgi:pyruvate carboxylase